MFASEGRKTRMEMHQVAVRFGNGGHEIIEPKLACDATHGYDSERTFQSSDCGEFQIQLAAVTFHQTEGVKFSRMPLIGKRVEVSPVDEAFSRPRFHALESLSEGAPSAITDARGASLLTNREMSLVQLVAEGRTNRDISRELI